MPTSVFIVLVITVPVLTAASTGSALIAFLTLGLTIAANPIARIVRKNRYFGSDQFNKIRADLGAVVHEHNEVVAYVGEIRTSGLFELGTSSSGQYAHLATSDNTSLWNYKRDRNVAVYAPHIHNASLQVVRSAQVEPIKYVMKYFSIKPDQSTLANVQRVADDIARLEAAIVNVREREGAIQSQINPPRFILKHYATEFWSRVGAQLSPIEVPYSKYTFQYVSAGGNSGQTTSLVLDSRNLEALSLALVDRIRWAKSAAGQRALMTSSLRDQIKRRDDFTCRQCQVSLRVEPHLLLEIDHIQPVSRGGLSVPENLQTLCWKCNRTKGARIVTAPNLPMAAGTRTPVRPGNPTPTSPTQTPRSTTSRKEALKEDGQTAHGSSGPRSATPKRDQGRADEPALAVRPKPGRNVSTPTSNPDQPRFAVLDVETTGLNPATGRVLEIAIVTTTVYGHVLDEWSTKINPMGPVGPTHIHGIRSEDVVTAPVFRDVIAQITLRLAGAALVAHNASFELSFLQAEYRRAGWDLPRLPYMCTLEASSYYLPQLDRRRLADCCWAVGAPLVGAHTALGDARATVVLLAAFLHPNWGPPPTAHHSALALEAQKVAWPSGPARPPTDIQSAAITDGFRESTPTAAPPALAALLDRLSLADALAEGAPAGSIAYLEMLAEALEDGEISDMESLSLASAAQLSGWSTQDVAANNQMFVLALAHEAARDGHVSRAEKAELLTVAARLQLDPKIVPALIDRAEIDRETKIGKGLSPLPVRWTLGVPLRVGDRVAFTGCGAFNRPDLEARAINCGVRVLGSVSSRVDMLISDGTVSGAKASAAQFLATRVVHPTDFMLMLHHLQPALPRKARPVPEPRERKTAPSPAPVTAPPALETAPLPDGVTPTQVRQWGRDNGWQVGARGRLDRKLMRAYLDSHSSPNG